MTPDRTRALLNDVMQHEDEKEARGTNLVIALAAGSYGVAGFQLVCNHHYIVQLVWGQPINYVFRQQGFNA
jgi:hypothetical protein